MRSSCGDFTQGRIKTKEDLKSISIKPIASQVKKDFENSFNNIKDSLGGFTNPYILFIGSVLAFLIGLAFTFFEDPDVNKTIISAADQAFWLSMSNIFGSVVSWFFIDDILKFVEEFHPM